MAAFPCTIHPHRYSGPQRSVYVTALNGSRPDTKKHRVCNPHFLLLVEFAERRMQRITEDSQMSMACEWPDCALNRDTTIFAKAFEQSEEPQEWAADFCAVHAEQALAVFAWDRALAL